MMSFFALILLPHCVAPYAATNSLRNVRALHASITRFNYQTQSTPGFRMTFSRQCGGINVQLAELAVRKVQTNFHAVVNVKALPYDATCDGIADDTKALDSAFASGRSIYIPSGATCRTSSHYTLHSRTDLYGAGAAES